MPELIINGPGGRIEARYHHEPKADSPIALITGGKLGQIRDASNNLLVSYSYDAAGDLAREADLALSICWPNGRYGSRAMIRPSRTA